MGTDKSDSVMTSFEKQVIETLAELKTLITEDHKLLRGNGHPGLVDRVSSLESNVGVVNNFKDMLESLVSLKADVEVMKQQKKWWHGLVVDGVAVICMGVSIYCAFFK